MIVLKKDMYLIRADPPGFEPGTFGLEVRRPVQLGYGPLFTDIHILFIILYKSLGINKFQILISDSQSILKKESWIVYYYPNHLSYWNLN